MTEAYAAQLCRDLLAIPIVQEKMNLFTGTTTKHITPFNLLHVLINTCVSDGLVGMNDKTEVIPVGKQFSFISDGEEGYSDHPYFVSLMEESVMRMYPRKPKARETLYAILQHLRENSFFSTWSGALSNGIYYEYAISGILENEQLEDEYKKDLQRQARLLSKRSFLQRKFNEVFVKNYDIDLHSFPLLTPLWNAVLEFCAELPIYYRVKPNDREEALQLDNIFRLMYSQGDVASDIIAQYNNDYYQGWGDVMGIVYHIKIMDGKVTNYPKQAHNLIPKFNALIKELDKLENLNEHTKIKKENA